MENFNFDFEVPTVEPIDEQVEEQVEETVEETVVDEPQDIVVPDEDNVVAAYQTFKALGVLDEEEFDGTFDSLQRMLEQREEKRYQEVGKHFVENAPERFKTLLQFAYNEVSEKGDIDMESFEKMVRAFKEDNSSTITDDASAREYLEQVYKEQGMKEKAIKAALDALEEEDELLETALEESKKGSSKKQKELLEQQEKEREKQEREQRAFLEKIEGEMKKTGWTEARMKNAKIALANSQKIMAEVSQNPAAIVQLADILAYYKNGKFDIEALAKTIVSKEVKKIQDNILKDQFNRKTQGTNETKRNPLEGFKPVLEID